MNNLVAIWAHFDQPVWLLTGLAAIAPVALAIRNRRRGGKISRLGVFLQSLVLLLAAVSLAGPVVPFSMRTPRWLILRDVSASVGEQTTGTLNLPSGVAFERHSFAGRVLGQNERDALDATRLHPTLEWSAAAIQTGRADGAIFLTDGQFQDDWQEAARNFAQTRAPLWIVPLDAPPRDARVETVTSKRRPFRQGRRLIATYDLSITVIANAPMRRALKVFQISPGGTKRELMQSEILLEPRGPTTIHLRDTLPYGAVGIWEAELSPHDALSQNDTLQAVNLPPERRVAWLAKDDISVPDEVAYRPKETVERIQPSDALTSRVGWLQYAAVVISDATGRLLSPQQRSALAAYVRGGGGLVLLGAGPHDTPADRNDPLNLVLPLRADPFERNPLNLTVVLDASGSMAETFGSPAQPKWSLASEAVLALREHLTPADRLRVIVFSDAARTIYDSNSAGPDFPALGDALRDVHPSGPTNIIPALEQVLQTPPEKNATHLVLILSDLQTAKFDPTVIAKRFEEQGRRLAVVATGSTDIKKTSLAPLAEQLYAPLVYREHLQGLADVFGKLCRRARGDAILRGDFILQYDSAWPEAARVLWLDAIILAATTSKARVDARVEETGEPILAICPAGLGKAVVVSAPPKVILDKPGSNKLLAELIHRVIRPGDDPRFDVQTTRKGDALHIRVTVRDGEQAVNNLSPRAEVLGLLDPSAAPILAQCLQSAPGVYEANIPFLVGRGEAPAMRVLDKVDGRLCWQGVAPAGYPDEFARLGADYETLRELATITGGRIVEADALSSPVMRDELLRPRRSGRAIWRFTLAGAIIAMLLVWLGGSLRRFRYQRG